MIREKYFHYLLFSLVFTQGLIEYNDLPSFIYKVGIPFIIIILFTKKLLSSEIKKVPFYPLIFAFMVLSIISFLNSNTSLLSFVYFIIYTIFPYLYFIIIINSEDDDAEEIKGVSKYLVFLVLLQIPVSIYKYFTIGQSEHGLIGTLSTLGGSISTIFPLFAISFIFAKILYDKKWIYFSFIVGFILMSLIGEKRAIGFYAPLVMLFIYLVYHFKEKSLFNLSTLINLLIIAMIGVSFFYISARLNPSLNPENKVWGSFSMKYIRNYSIRYNTRDYSKHELQRVAAFKYFTEYLIKKKGATLLIGEGPGKLVESKFKSEGGTMLEQYGVRYGGRTTFIWLWLQTGLLGSFTYLGFILAIWLYLFRHYKHSYISLGLIGCVLVYIFDVFSYSNTFLKEFCLSIPFYFILAYHYLNVTRHPTELKDDIEDQEIECQ